MTIKQTIQAWLDETNQMIKDDYQRLGFRASGDFEKELSNEIVEQDGKYNSRILGIYYTYWMVNGRRLGKFPPIDKIKDWIKQKGILAEKISENSLAFLIARKIAQQGTKERPELLNALSQQRIDELFKSVGQVQVEQIKSDVIKTLK